MVQVTFSFLYKPPMLDLSSMAASPVACKDSKYTASGTGLLKLFGVAAEIQM